MGMTLEKLWHEYIYSECSQINSEEEKGLIRKVAKLHEKANTLLNEKQKSATDEYVDALYDVQALYAKKAFFKGCEFALSFLLEIKNLNY